MNFKKISFITFFIIAFYEILIKLRSEFCPLKTIYWKLLRHCPTIKTIYIPLLKIGQFFIFVIIFYVFLISFCVLIYRVTYSPLIPFPTINNISISVKRSTFTLVFFKAAFHGNLGAEKNFAGSNSYILIHIPLKF